MRNVFNAFLIFLFLFTFDYVTLVFCDSNEQPGFILSYINQSPVDGNKISSNSFSEENLISSREYSASIRIDENYTFIIGGLSVSGTFSNDIWIMKYYENSTHRLFLAKEVSAPSTSYGYFESSSNFSSSNIFGGRYKFGALLNYEESFIMVFYGYGFLESSTLSYMGDVWIIRLSDYLSKYILNTKISSSTVSTASHVFSSSNIISKRSSFAFSKLNSTIFSMHGGQSVKTLISSAYLGDFWLIKYNQNNIFEPAFMGGTTTKDCYSTSTSGTQIYDSSYYPACRYSHSSFFDRSKNRIFIFGGYSTGGITQDLWAYDITSFKFAWISGVNPTASVSEVANSYLIGGIYNSTNLPGSRYAFSSYFDENFRIFIVFGGLNSDDSYNDVWIFSSHLFMWKTLQPVSSSKSDGSKGIYSSSNVPIENYGSMWKVRDGVMANFGCEVGGLNYLHLIGISNCFEKNILNNEVCNNKHGVCSYNDDFECYNCEYGYNASSSCDMLCLDGCSLGICDAPLTCTCYNGNIKGELCNSCTNDNFNFDSNCTSCKNHFDITKQCLICEINYYGDSCNVTTCNGILSNDSMKVCGGDNNKYGSCLSYNKCSCDSFYALNYEYNYCSVVSCFGIPGNYSSVVCNGNGLCVQNDKCNCYSGWAGSSNCSEISCNGTLISDPLVCNSHGVCASNNSCNCYFGYSGQFCDETVDFDYTLLLIILLCIFVPIISIAATVIVAFLMFSMNKMCYFGLPGDNNNNRKNKKTKENDDFEDNFEGDGENEGEIDDFDNKNKNKDFELI